MMAARTSASCRAAFSPPVGKVMSVVGDQSPPCFGARRSRVNISFISQCPYDIMQQQAMATRVYAAARVRNHRQMIGRRQPLAHSPVISPATVADGADCLQLAFLRLSGDDDFAKLPRVVLLGFSFLKISQTARCGRFRHAVGTTDITHFMQRCFFAVRDFSRHVTQFHSGL